MFNLLKSFVEIAHVDTCKAHKIRLFHKYDYNQRGVGL